MKPFAAFDIDGTLIRWQLYHAIADALVKLGYFKASGFEQVRFARMQWKQRASDEAYRAYEEKLVATYQKALKQITTDQLDEAVDLVFDEYKDQVYVFTRDLLRNLKHTGYLLFAISNSQAEIIKKIAGYYGFDDFVGGVYGRSGNKFTGEKIVYLKDKDQVLKKLVDKHNATWKDSVAVGDSAGDIPMLATVDKPVAFNPERKLFNKAKRQGWEIIVERKSVVYRLEAKNGSYLLD